MKEFLHQALANNHYSFSDQVEDKFVTFLELLHKWNRITNLTAIRDPKESVLLHILDSLSIQHYLHGDNIIDVGSGAGLPGIPLALVCPDKHFVLLDSNNKKTTFLKQVCYELDIKNIEVIQERVEKFQPTRYFDSIITRAFSTIKTMLEMTKHLLSEQGEFLAMKGVYPLTEIKEIPEPFTLLSAHHLIVKGLTAERYLLCIGRR